VVRGGSAEHRISNLPWSEAAEVGLQEQIVESLSGVVEGEETE
jgi:hypothetical protein